MGIFFLDSNIVIKHYFSVPDSAWVRNFVNDSENSCIISEVASALSVQNHLSQPVTFVSGDRQALVVAKQNQLITDNPFDHVALVDTEYPKT